LLEEVPYYGQKNAPETAADHGLHFPNQNLKHAIDFGTLPNLSGAPIKMISAKTRILNTSVLAEECWITVDCTYSFSALYV